MEPKIIEAFYWLLKIPWRDIYLGFVHFFIGRVGGIWRVAPVEYDDPPFIRIFSDGNPLYPKVIEMSPSPRPLKKKKKKKRVNYHTEVIIVSVLLKKVSVL